MKPEHIWLAGILEGEGSFCSGPPSNPNCPTVKVEMKDLDIVERVAKLFNVNYIHERQGKGNWSTTYRVQISGKPARKIMEIVRPLMGERRKRQIDKASA